MTNPTPHGQVPEALRLAEYIDDLMDGSMVNYVIDDLEKAAAELRRLHAYCQELESQVIRDCMTHVQNPAEIEHVAGGVSKNGAELNTSTQQPAPAGATPAEAVERIVHLRAYRERRIYVAGPMTGLPEYNFPLFNSTAERLRSEGWHVENPAEHGHVEGAGWADYLRWDISRIATCGAIYLLPGWSNSKGATLEVHIAGVLGLEVLLADGAEAPTPQPTPAAGVTVEQVEDAIGLQSTAWDTIGAEKIVEAVLRLTNGQAPATQQAGEVVAYLDIGAGGYLDLGSELSDEAMQQLPKGRHALVIAGTYGIDGYVAAPQPSPTAQAASSTVLKAIREANMQLVRTGDNAFMLVPYKVATAQAAESVPAVMSGDELVRLGKSPESGLYPWGIGTTRADYLRAVRAVLAAARARLLDSDLSNLTERGAAAWAGVDVQKLREDGTT